MPSEYPFCRRKYIQSGAYEKHLRIAHTNQDIVLGVAGKVTYDTGLGLILENLV